MWFRKRAVSCVRYIVHGPLHSTPQSRIAQARRRLAKDAHDARAPRHILAECVAECCRREPARSRGWNLLLLLLLLLPVARDGLERAVQPGGNRHVHRHRGPPSLRPVIDGTTRHGRPHRGGRRRDRRVREEDFGAIGADAMADDPCDGAAVGRLEVTHRVRRERRSVEDLRME